MNEIRTVSCDQIAVTLTDNDLKDEKLLTLAQSIKDDEVFKPFLLKKVDDHYTIIGDRNLYKALLLKGVRNVSAIIVNDDDSSPIIADLQRNKKDVIGEALTYEEIMQKEDLTQSELAMRLGLKQSTIANKLRLLKLPMNIREGLKNGLISERHGRALLKVPDDKQEAVYQTIIQRHYNVKESEAYIATLLQHKQKGFSNNIRIGINTINEAFKLCQNSGLDCQINQRESEDEVQLIIRFRK